jgi:hypothetical protein
MFELILSNYGQSVESETQKYIVKKQKEDTPEQLTEVVKRETRFINSTNVPANRFQYSVRSTENNKIYVRGNEH